MRKHGEARENLALEMWNKECHGECEYVLFHEWCSSLPCEVKLVLQYSSRDIRLKTWNIINCYN